MMLSLHIKNRPDMAFSINWAALLSFAFFWLWGVHAYPAGSSLNILPVNVLIVFLFAYFTHHRFSSNFQSTFSLTTRTILLFLFVAVMATLLSWRHLNQPLWGDQIYHASYAARHGQLLIFFLDQRLPSLLNELKGLPASMLIWGANVILLVILFSLFILIPRLLSRHKKIFLAVMLGALLLTRMFLSGEANVFSAITGPAFLPTDYGSDPHPVFRLFPLVLSSTIFGVSEFGYRAAAFSGYLLFLFFLYVRLNEQVGWKLATAASIALGTVPVFWHVSYLVEQSVWSTLFSATIFVMLLTAKDQNTISLIAVVSLVILATLLRSPAFVAFAPVAFLIAYRVFKGNIKRSDRMPLIMLLLSLVLIVVISALRGSPATDAEGPVTKWIYAESNNIPAVAAVSVLGVMPLFFIGFVFRTGTRDSLLTSLGIISFFLVCGIVYYAPVTRILWGVGRYQAEIYIPLIAAGLIAYCMSCGNENRQWKAALPLLFLILVNAFSLLTFDNKVFRPFADHPPPGEAVKAEIEYPLNEAFQLIQKHNLRSHTDYIGIYYGGFVSLLAGYKTDEYLNFFKLNDRHRSGWTVNLDELHADPDILSVIVEPEADFGAVQGLKERGWKGVRELVHPHSGRKLIVVARENL